MPSFPTASRLDRGPVHAVQISAHGTWRTVSVTYKGEEVAELNRVNASNVYGCDTRAASYDSERAAWAA